MAAAPTTSSSQTEVDPTSGPNPSPSPFPQSEKSRPETTTASPMDEAFYEPRPWSTRTFAEQYKPFRGMYHDVRRRLPFYWGDWKEGFEGRNLYRVVASAIRMYFINLMPAIAYILDMNYRTNGAYGINEGILASALAAIVFPIFSVQPLTIVGVTGLINLVNYTHYDIVVNHYGINFLQFQAWMLIWSAISHWLIAIFNLCDLTRFITDMTSETFGLYVGVIYIQKGIEELILAFTTLEAGWLSVLVAILFCFSVYYVEQVGTKGFGPRWIRRIAGDFGFVLGCVWWSGFVHIPGNIKSADVELLPITRSWYPTQDRSWFIDFWNLPVRWIFISIPFGLLVTLLFYFDHNVSSLMCQARQYPVRKVAGFHWDFFLLGITTLVSGFLGLPAPNGLVPQAPVNTDSLLEKKVRVVRNVRKEMGVGTGERDEVEDFEIVEDVRVVEQRVSHLAIGLLTLGTMTRPLLVALGTMPRAVFAGVFILVGWGSVSGNGIVHKTLYLLRDRTPGMIPRDHPLRGVARRKILLFISIQWLVFAMTVAISQTIAAIGFPVIITLLIPARHYIVPKYFTPRELKALDAPTANSEAVIVSIGGDIERVTGEGRAVAEDTGIEGTRPDLAADAEERSDLEKAEIRQKQDENGEEKEGLRRRTGKAPQRDDDDKVDVSQ